MSDGSLRLAARTLGVPPANEIVERAVLVPLLILERVREAMLDGETHYTSRPGMPLLRRQIATTLGRLGAAAIDAESGVVVTSGEREAMFVTLMSLRAKRGAIATLAPTSYEPLFELLGWRSAAVGRAPAFSPRVFYRDTSLSHEQHRLALRGIAPDVVDLLNVGTAIAGEHALPPVTADQTLLLGSCDGLEGQEAFGTGFIAGPPALMGAVRTWKQAFSICTAAPSQRAALTAFEMKARPA